MGRKKILKGIIAILVLLIFSYMLYICLAKFVFQSAEDSAIKTVYNYSNLEVRNDAILGLGQFKSKKSLDVLISLLRNDDYSVRLITLSSLRSRKDKTTCPYIFPLIYDDNIPQRYITDAIHDICSPDQIMKLKIYINNNF
jgi:HEAT repeat protein